MRDVAALWIFLMALATFAFWVGAVMGSGRWWPFRRHL